MKSRQSLGKGLVLRRGVIQKRRQLPADVQAVLGKESVISLKTSDVAKARELAAVIDEEIDLAVEAVRAEGPGMDDERILAAREAL